jgi:superfamily II DNA or RNA helicase
MKPRPYQSECIAAVEHGWAEAAKQLIVLATGGGKTCIFSFLAEREHLAGRKTLILSHREELVDQAIAKLKAFTGISAGREKAESWASLSDSVVVASVQSIARRLDRWPPNHFGLVVADEAHHAIAPSWQVVLRHFDSHANVLGVTATPDRGDARNLGSYFQRIAFEMGLFDLIDDGYLSPIAVKSIPLKIDLSGVSVNGGDFDDADLGDALDPYLPSVARAIQEHASFQRTLVFLPLRKTSRRFVEICNDIGMTAAHIDGDSENRKEILERFARWDFDVLSNAMLLTEGFDDPGIDCIVCLRPTKSRSLYSQIVGRGTRVSEGKERLLLLDFLWMHERHQIVRPAHLIATTDEEADQITRKLQERCGGEIQEELDLQNITEICCHEREQALARKLKELKNRKTTLISAEEFALRHNKLSIAEYEPVMPWESQAITEKQLKVLKRAKIDPETVKGKGHASKIINVIFSQAKITLASAAQQAFMAKMGHPSPQTATQEEARRFFASLNK